MIMTRAQIRGRRLSIALDAIPPAERAECIAAALLDLEGPDDAHRIAQAVERMIDRERV